MPDKRKKKASPKAGARGKATKPSNEKAKSKPHTEKPAPIKTAEAAEAVPKVPDEDADHQDDYDTDDADRIDADDDDVARVDSKEGSDDEVDEINDLLKHIPRNFMEDAVDADSASSYTGSTMGSSGSNTTICPSGEYSGSSLSSLGSLSSGALPVEYRESSTENMCSADREITPISRGDGSMSALQTSETEGGEKDVNYKEAPDFKHITTYDAYLDHYVSPLDLYYLESEEDARKITTLGFRVPELLTREQFAEIMLEKEEQLKAFAQKKHDAHVSLLIPSHLIHCPLMKELAIREKKNRTGNLACLIYIRVMNKKKQEVSGWIDFRHRLAKDGVELWSEFFSSKKKLMPRPSDISYYNWTTFQVRYNSSANYLITTDVVEGLQFMNKLDRKLITVNPKVPPGDNTTYIQIKSHNYIDCAIYDHGIRVKA